MQLNHIYNEDGMLTMKRFDDNSIDIVITSPPYNLTKRRGGNSDSGRYDVYTDWKTEDEYINWTIDFFNEYNRVIKENRVILYNFSYEIENTSLPYKLVVKLIENTEWTLADTIIWKKSCAIPHPASYNRLNRIIEFVWVFCRKSELKTFKMFKKVKSVSKNGQKYYEIVDNFLTAKNNDGACKLNQDTFSSDLIVQLLDKYAQPDDIVYDSFMGTGTVSISCLIKGCNYIGSEISLDQCKYAEERINSFVF